MRQRLLLPVLFILLMPLSADALDDIQGVTAVWNDFAASLRRGDYRRAHALFSPQSRAVLPYGEFVAEYGPLSAAREMVLARPDSQATSLDGDWAELAYGGVNPGSGRKFRVVVAFARNHGAWGLVAARNEAAERTEAGARALLARLWDNRRLAGPKDLLAAMEKAQAGNPVLQHYRMEWDGSRFQAFPRETGGGLRAFYVDSEGAVRSVDRVPTLDPLPDAPQQQPVPVAAPAPVPMPDPAPPPPPTATVDGGMPELTEPPPAGGFSASLDDELPEPPPPPAPAGRRAAARERPALTLPDVIE